MLRTRKKDINLKPNRILDKKSSRGMLYENEELRIRTHSIHDEVDKSQNNIKKLKKENEHLKHEIWGLREECEKLEEMLKKLFSVDSSSSEIENFKNSYKFPERRRRSENTISGCDSEDDDYLNFEDDAQLESVENNYCHELQVLKEESENSTPNRSPIQNMAQNTCEQYKPLIQITRASTPENSNVHVTNQKATFKILTNEREEEGKNFQELGCIAQVPQKYKVSTTLSLDESNAKKSLYKKNPKLEKSSNKFSTFRKKYLPKFYKSEPILCKSQQSESIESLSINIPNLCEKETNNFIILRVCENVDENSLVVDEEEVIDEIERQTGGIMRFISSVRVINNIIFIHTNSSLEEEGSLKIRFIEEIKRLEIRNRGVSLVEEGEICSDLTLGQVPPEIQDSTLLLIFNQFGQVLSPVRRKFYKGIEIWERNVKIHLSHQIPLKINFLDSQFKILHNLPPQTSHQCNCELLKLTSQDSQEIFKNSTSSQNASHIFPKCIITSNNESQKIESKLNEENIPHITSDIDQKSKATQNFDVESIDKIKIDILTTTGSENNDQTDENVNHSETNLNFLNPHVKLNRVSRTLSSAPRLELNENSGLNCTPDFKRQMSLGVESLNFPVINGPPTKNIKVGAYLTRNPPSCGEGSKMIKPLKNEIISPSNPNSNSEAPIGFYRSMSIDPRRRSSTSRYHEITNVINMPKSNGKNEVENSKRNEMGMRTSSSFETKKKRHSELPWFSCMGNGCI